MKVQRLRAPEVVRMRRAGAVARDTLEAVRGFLRPGLTTADLDAFVRQDTARRGARPSQLGYQGFRHVVCTSVNDVVCHGVPSGDVTLTPGDIVNVDVTSELGGYHGDTSATLAVGPLSPRAARLVEAAEQAMWAGIDVVRPGATLGDVGAAVQEVARARGYSVVDSYGGHFIGRRMHLPPHVPYAGPRGTGLKLKAGMCFTVEPMLNEGGPQVRLMPDGWTVRTADGGLSAQFEHTVLVTSGGVEVLTR